MVLGQFTGISGYRFACDNFVFMQEEMKFAHWSPFYSPFLAQKWGDDADMAEARAFTSHIDPDLIAEIQQMQKDLGYNLWLLADVWAEKAFGKKNFKTERFLKDKKK